MMQLIDFFQSEGYAIIIASATTDSPYVADLESRDVQKVAIELNNSSFDEYVKKLNPSIVVFDRYLSEEQFGWRVAKICPDALRVLDTEDLHCLRYARETALLQNQIFNDSFLVSDLAKREIASIYRCDISLIISTYEMELLQRFFKVNSSLIHYLPFMLNSIDNQPIAEINTYEQRSHFISIGNFLHKPNWDAVLYLKHEIWPIIRTQLPKAEIHIYGAYPTQKVFELQNEKEGFLIKGRADNAQTVMCAASICLAPLRFGAGLKGKLVEAMQCGTPSVTTTIGAESMHADLPWCGAIANTPQEIADAAVALYNDKNEWRKAQQNGFDIINTCYQKIRLEALLRERIKNVLTNLQTHRLANFTGEMLMHHTMQSTKYMSRWIEEKNKTQSPL
jgi:glycosyltransferase involved in cell wall biosynthesis